MRSSDVDRLSFNYMIVLFYTFFGTVIGLKLHHHEDDCVNHPIHPSSSVLLIDCRL